MLVLVPNNDIEKAPKTLRKLLRKNGWKSALSRHAYAKTRTQQKAEKRRRNANRKLRKARKLAALDSSMIAALLPNTPR